MEHWGRQHFLGSFITACLLTRTTCVNVVALKWSIIHSHKNTFKTSERKDQWKAWKQCVLWWIDRQRSPNKDIKEDLKCMLKYSHTFNREKKPNQNKEVLLENLVVVNDEKNINKPKAKSWKLITK